MNEDDDMPELIDLANRGYLVTIEKLWNESQEIRDSLDVNVDISLSACSLYIEKHSALSVAWYHNHFHIVKWLVERGANPNAVNVFGNPRNGYFSILQMMDEQKFKVDPQTFITILRKVKHFNPPFTFYEGMKIKDITLAIYFAQHSCNWMLIAYLIEAILRGDAIVVNEILTHQKISITISSTLFAEMLTDRDLDLEKKPIIFDLLQRVRDRKIIADDEMFAIKNIIIEHLKITVKNFPAEIQQDLISEPPHTLSQLFAEFQYWCYPEEMLPVMCTSSQAYDETKYNKTKQEIINWQNPLRLRKFLEQDQLSILTRLHLIDEEASNPALLLLAQIILYKAHDLISSANDSMQSLLTKEQQLLGVKIIRKYNTENSVLLAMLKNQNQKINNLQYQNETLMEKVNDLANMNQAIKNQLETITQQLTKVSNKLASPEENKAPQVNRTSPSLFVKKC